VTPSSRAIDSATSAVSTAGSKPRTPAAPGQAAGDEGGLIGGRYSVGYGYQSIAAGEPRADEERGAAERGPTTASPSGSRTGRGVAGPRPAPKPRASIASASRTESSIAVRTTGTRTSFQDRRPRGRQPRIRWASRTSVKVRPKPETRFSDVATAMPVRSSGPGMASTTSCGSRTSESGATASSAATSPSPSAPPNGERLDGERAADERPVARQTDHHVGAGVACQDVDQRRETGGDQPGPGQRLDAAARRQPRQQDVQRRQRHEAAVDGVVRRQRHGHGRERPDEPGPRGEVWMPGRRQWPAQGAHAGKGRHERHRPRGPNRGGGAKWRRPTRKDSGATADGLGARDASHGPWPWAREPGAVPVAPRWRRTLPRPGDRCCHGRRRGHAAAHTP
jgi:hypothetical protein